MLLIQVPLKVDFRTMVSGSLKPSDVHAFLTQVEIKVTAGAQYSTAVPLRNLFCSACCAGLLEGLLPQWFCHATIFTHASLCVGTTLIQEALSKEFKVDPIVL